MYYAHSRESSNRDAWQPLACHLHNVANLSQRRAVRFGAARAAHVTGLLHDLGKYTGAFQRRLEGASETVDHSTAGAATALALASGSDRAIAELIAYAIAGHHAGLPDKGAPTDRATLEGRLAQFDDAKLDGLWRNEITADVTGLAPAPAFEFGSTRETLAFRFAFLGRMLFSCLVDADFEDTEHFYRPDRGAMRAWPTLSAVLPKLQAGYEAHIAAFGEPATRIDVLRHEILAHVRGKARESPGLFTLTVPTGGGKTLASLGFALDHAAAHGLGRIVYALPFTAIIDQTAKTFRDVLGDDVVLEHHSAIEDDRFEVNAERADGAKGQKEKLKLAMEDWAAPVIVTTNVQLFESLFAARPSRCRKLHNLAGSVIVLDEAQTLPRHLLVPTVWAIDELARNYGATVILCTATQPAFDRRQLSEGHRLGLTLEDRELAPDPSRLAGELRRTTLRLAGEICDDALLDEFGGVDQGLVIVNSRGHALDLFRAGCARGLDGLIHLTTRQYAAHRRQILDDIRARLKAGAPCRVIATSLVEAGVDLDFPRVWRAEAGLDQIAQAAGRCNREFTRPVADSVVTVFTAPGHPPPSEIRGLIGDRERMQHLYDDLFSPAAMEHYFREVFWRAGDALDREMILADFRVDRETHFNYRTVANKYRMIESGMSPVIVAKDDPARDAVSKLGISELRSGRLAAVLQPYIVQVPLKARARLIANRHVQFEAPELRMDQFAVLLTDGLYREEMGLLWEDADYLSEEQLLF